MQKTSIEWTDFSSSPLKYRDASGRTVWACIKVSAGCTHCYSATLANRFGRGTDYNAAEMAKLTPYLDEKELHWIRTSPLLTGKRVFLEDMSDLFGEWVPDDLLNRLFSQTLEVRTDCVFQILTKRADRMHRYLSWRWGADEDHPRGRIPSRHIWIGVSAEDQQRADERIPLLLRTPAAVRFVSAEPLIGPVDVTPWVKRGSQCDCGIHRGTQDGCEPGRGMVRCNLGMRRLSLVIAGGESGAGARPNDIQWTRAIVRACRTAGVAAFVKQLGARCETDKMSDLNGHKARGPRWLVFRDRKGGDPSEWPADLRVREFPGEAVHS